MNIIKLKDQILPESISYSEYFNTYLKGKYAYWVRMRYIVSFEHMDIDDYVSCEEDITNLQNIQHLDSKNLDIEYIDVVETNNVNDITKFKLKNSFSPDNNITIVELKNFRTWLASTLIKLDQDNFGEQKNVFFDDLELHVLKYYSNDMYNETVKNLIDFGSSNISIESINTSSCGCSGSNISSLYNHEINLCDPLSIYKKNIYNKMVEMFSDYDFWVRFPKEFIVEFKNYIDNIINCGFSLTQSDWVNSFMDCCGQDKQTQNEFVEILKNLSKSLNYISTEQISGHKNFINDSLFKWAQLLYESMKW